MKVSVLAHMFEHNEQLATIRGLVCLACSDVAYARHDTLLRHNSDIHASAPLQVVGVLVQCADVPVSKHTLPAGLRIKARVVGMSPASTLATVGEILTPEQAQYELDPASADGVAPRAAEDAGRGHAILPYARIVTMAAPSMADSQQQSPSRSYAVAANQGAIVASAFGFARLDHLASAGAAGAAGDAANGRRELLGRYAQCYLAAFVAHITLFGNQPPSVQSILTGAKSRYRFTDALIQRRASMAAAIAAELAMGNDNAGGGAPSPPPFESVMAAWCSFMLDPMDMDGGRGDNRGDVVAAGSTDPLARNSSLLAKHKMLELLVRRAHGDTAMRSLTFDAMEELLGDLGFLVFIARQHAYTRVLRTNGKEAADMVDDEAPLNVLSFTRDCRHKLALLAEQHGGRVTREALVAANATQPGVVTVNGHNYPDSLVRLVYDDVVRELRTCVDEYAVLLPSMRAWLAGDTAERAGLRWQDVVDRPTNDGTYSGSSSGRGADNVLPFCWRTESQHPAMQAAVDEAWRAFVDKRGQPTASKLITDVAERMMRALATAVYLSGGGPPRCTDFVGAHAGLAGTGGRHFFFVSGVGLASGMRNSKVSGMLQVEADTVFRAYPSAVSDAMATWLLVCGPLYLLAMASRLETDAQLAALAHDWRAHLFWLGPRKPAKSAATFRRVIGDTLDTFARRHCLTPTLGGPEHRLGVREMRHLIAHCVWYKLFAGNAELTSALRADVTTMVPLLLREDAVAHFALLARFGPQSAQQGGRHLATMMESYALGNTNYGSGHASGVEARCMVWFACSRMFHHLCGMGDPSGATHYKGLSAVPAAAAAAATTGASRRTVVFPSWDAFRYVSTRPAGSTPEQLANEQALARALYTRLFAQQPDARGAILVVAMGGGKTELLVRLAHKLRGPGVGVWAVICPLVTTAKQTVARANALERHSAVLARHFYDDSLLAGMLAPGGAHLWHPCCLVVFTPEFVATSTLLGTLAAHGRLMGIAVDDAHSILDTSDDFRASFARLGDHMRAAVQKSLPQPVAIVALTGTLAVRDEGRLNAALWPHGGGPKGDGSVIRIGQSIGANLWYRVVRVDGGGGVGGAAESSSLDAALVRELCTPSLALDRFSDTMVFVLTHDDVTRTVQHLLGSAEVMAIFASVRGISRTLVDQDAGLDDRILSDLARPLADGRPRVLVATPKLESGVSLAGVGKSIVVRASYGLATGLQQMGRAGRAGQPDAEAVLICRPTAAATPGGGAAAAVARPPHNAVKATHVLSELADVFLGATCIVGQLRELMDGVPSAGYECFKCTPCIAKHGMPAFVACRAATWRASTTPAAHTIVDDKNDAERAVRSASGATQAATPATAMGVRRARTSTDADNLPSPWSLSPSSSSSQSFKAARLSNGVSPSLDGGLAGRGAGHADDDAAYMDAQLNEYMAQYESPHSQASVLALCTPPQPLARPSSEITVPLYTGYRERLQAAASRPAAQPPTVNAFTQPLLPAMLPPKGPCGRDNAAFMAFVGQLHGLITRKRCILAVCTRTDGHTLDKCPSFPPDLCKMCGALRCTGSRGGTCAAKLVVPPGKACFHCWLNHEGNYQACKESGAANYVRPLFVFATHYAGLDVLKAWAQMWSDPAKRFEFLDALLMQARKVQGKPDPFVKFL